ncbi:hypothetical protein KC343_g2819 [Hortaea werneckii]|uniref:G domain-containing protein n=1 Tax=Hortaea werneckii TaxID=91943 RepID=A0A3M7EZI7_HORWE|nr:hypothetical protein KC352_g16329 [Hortaea werneckii]KAI7569586.1 hypothetical protein KC317_g3202 [Hortaea werneckii]KAI7610668.1 hypothetical protein KC346_g8630 [Hortaea werneckii]KAI7633647.1 hypothetical protein KC343_g2819 [Hortaea werneckii]KAI7663260.1 hypothetical protein KC319_g7824 [Hortaea werneckii]
MGDLFPLRGNTGKRKRSNEDDDYVSDGDEGEGLFVSDTDDDFDLGYDDSDDYYEDEAGSNIEDDIQPHEEIGTTATLEDEITTGTIDPDAIYSERGEAYPKSAAYDEAIPKIKSAYTGIAQQVLNIIKTNPCNSAVLAKFVAKSADLTTIPKSKSVKIALLGEMGTGKSSLLNSVIDIPDLARAFGGGESCTCVPSEYRNAFPDQRKRFAARVVYLDRAGVAKLIKDSADSYYNFYFAEKEPETLDQETQNQVRRRAQTAIATFCALFSKHAEFETFETGEEYLQQMAKNDRSIVPARLQEWAMEILKEQKTASGALNEYIEADDQQTFTKLISPMLNSDFRTNGASLWPLVKCVSIGIKESRVLENVTIADLPGITDTDTLKVNNALDYMRGCQAIWIVATVNRIITNPHVDDLLRRYEERYRGKITIIATRSDDDVNGSLAKGLREKHINIKGYDKQLVLQRKAQVQVSETKRTIASRLKAKHSKERTEKVKKLKSELAIHKESLNEASENKFAELVRARNGHVVSSMSESVKRHCPEGSTPRIICVSNLHYWTLKGVEDPGSFQLKAEDTGIPALRQIIYKLGAPGLLRILDDYIKYDFTVFLKGTNLWALSRYVPGAKELLSVVEKPQTLLGSDIEKYHDELQAVIDKMILQPLLSKVTRHSSEAVDMLELKRKHRHPATLKAFMRKGGNHCTANCPRESWNEQYLQGPSTVLNKSWERAKKHQDKLLNTLKKQITDEVANMLRTIKEDQRANRLELTSFEQMVAGQIRGIKNTFRDHQVAFHQELENIKIDATQDRHTGYFTSAMGSAYEKCREDYGAGTTQRCLGYVSAQLSLKDDRSPFFRHATMLADTMDKLAKEQSKEVETRLRDILVDVYEHFDGMIASEFEDPSETPVRAALKTYMKDAGKRAEELSAELAAVKDKYNKVVKPDAMQDTDKKIEDLNANLAAMKKTIRKYEKGGSAKEAKKSNDK